MPSVVGPWPESSTACVWLHRSAPVPSLQLFIRQRAHAQQPGVCALEVSYQAAASPRCVLRMQEAADMVREQKNVKLAARQLTDEAFRRGSADNISCVVIRFHATAVRVR